MCFKSSFTLPAVAALCFCFIGGTTLAYADLGDQLFKLLADDGTTGDVFGRSVAISGTTVIVGVRGDDDNGEDSGSAYLFATTTGEQLFKLLADDGAATHRFGQSVAISGTTAIVGAVGDATNGTESGSAYLFDTTTGQLLVKLLPDEVNWGDEFGQSVAISGATGKQTAIVGARFGNDDNGVSSGTVFIFDISDPANPAQRLKLLPNDGAFADQFGFSVGISGTTAIIGAARDDDNGPNSGSAYLFDTTTGQQLFKLLPNDGAASDYFGYSVAISGTTAIVGAVEDDDNGDQSGSAYLFDITDPKNPVQIAKLLPDDGAANHRFGQSVAMSGTTAIVGATQAFIHGNGSAYLFNSVSGLQITKLTANDGAADDELGVSVAIVGPPGNEVAIVGALGDSDNGTESGSAYLFDAVAAPGKCPWDLDGNGSVGASDLLSLLVSWGPCKGCPADFDGNGSVGASDLLALLVNWGSCP